MHLVGRDSSDDECTNIYTVELVWPTQAIPSACFFTGGAKEPTRS
jgi:hypothetical protein